MSQHPQSTVLPQKGIAGLKENWRIDLQSGFLVFLIALPLCLGISIASGFPPSAGIITAIVGGVLVSRLNGSYLTINGPAAGLIVVIFAAVQTLGQGDAMAGYRYTLAAITFAGLLQVLLGAFKAGQLSSFFPSAVVHGMLAAIGIIIIATQIHVMLGTSPDPGNLFSTIMQIPQSFGNPTPEIAFIGLSGLAILMIWPNLKQPILKKIPAPVVVLLTGMVLGQFFGLQHEHLHLFFSDSTYLENHKHLIAPQFLVAIPDNFISNFFFPDFSKALTIEFWAAVISICLVGSLETLLSTSAVDKLDPYKRSSDLDRDLVAIGIGNTFVGFIGGLPMIAEIVRSKANVDNGAKTGWANFFHGMILLAFVILFPHLIHSIPLASLAALLVYTGYRLASLQSFKQVLAVGFEQFCLFVFTIIAVLATDLLIGVALGMVAKISIPLVRGVWLDNIFKIYFTIRRPDNNTIIVKISGSALFTNFMPLKRALAQLESGKTVVLNYSEGYLIDHTVMEFIDDFSRHYQTQGGKCLQIGHALEKFSDHDLAARIMTKDDRKTS